MELKRNEREREQNNVQNTPETIKIVENTEKWK